VAWVVTLCVIASQTAGTAIAASATKPGSRVTVALFGDSVTQSVLVANFQQDGFAPQLAAAERPLGFVPGGTGLISASPLSWHFNQQVERGAGPVPATGWTTIGSYLGPGLDGPSGYSALAISPKATATDTVTGPDVEILYTTSVFPCPFTVTTPGHSWSINPYQAGTPVDTGASIVIPPGPQQLTIHGPSCGLFSFNGVIAQTPAPPGKTQVEVENLGHAGDMPYAYFTPRVEQSVIDERYNISVFLFGYIAELAISPSLASQYVTGMLTRVKIARAHGGKCVIVQPAPITAPAAQIALVARLDREIATRGGCTYTSALAHLWSSPAAAERRGLVLVDGVHPNVAGYKLMSRALAPVLAPLIRAGAR
jgi:hypothetical protein